MCVRTLLILAEAAMEIGLAQVGMILAIVLLAVMAPYFIRRSRQRRSPPPGLKDIRKLAKDETQLRHTADQAVVDLLETSRELNAQVDIKIRTLNKLIKDADGQCQRLEKLLGVTPEPEADAVVSPADPEAAAAKRTSSGRWRSDLHARVSALHEEGKSDEEIARLTRISSQEVSLVLHLLAGAK